ncbi:hypothetical protein CRM22_001345 [Opisthorchis felineus]|uniref:Uncharacterized protein n=1 Tax=Opisthorchis felineus TaxID=147828 RepID=A0A4S2MH23_OPIFE|nr:hypothetical protein CRM22_001345 [Opisthorchis felineus]
MRFQCCPRCGSNTLLTLLIALVRITAEESIYTFRLGIIYDEFYDSSTFELQPLLDKLKPELERTRWLAQDTVNTSFVFLLRSYDLSQPCALLAERARAILSLTSCAVAKRIELYTKPRKIMHVAIPKPICPDKSYPIKDPPYDTVWLQPSMDHIIRVLQDLARMEQIPRAYLLTDGTSACALLAERARAILSLTSCAVAKRIELYTKPRKIMHVAIPKPICPDKSYPIKDPPYDTVWLQPSMDHIIRVLQDLARMEQIPRAYLLTDGTSAYTPFTVYNNFREFLSCPSKLFCPSEYQPLTILYLSSSTYYLSRDP